MRRFPAGSAAWVLGLALLTGVPGCAPGDRAEPRPGDGPPEAPDGLPADARSEATGPVPAGGAGDHLAGWTDPGGPFDWLLHGGTVVDGTGAPGRPADVLLRDGRIVHVGVVDPDTLEVAERFDAGGRVVAPGFIDLHAHGDPLQTPRFGNALAQGITTLLLGQDGSSPTAADLDAHLAAAAAARPSVHLGYLVGHNTLRGEAGLGAAPGTPEGNAALARLVTTALEAGAWGLSLGLEYSPGRFAALEELVALARPVADRDGVVMAHLRTEDTGAVGEAVQELLDVGRRSGARVHVSHLKVVGGNDPAEAGAILERMDAARAERGGSGVTGEVYPYLASFTGIGILFPDWARPPQAYDAVVAERREELAAHLRDRVQSRNGPGATLFGTGPWAGRTLEEAAAEAGRPFEDLLVELGPDGARAAYFVMEESVLLAFLRDPHVAIATDGSPSMAHPRGYGAFARVIRRHVVEEGHLPLEEAIRKMTSFPAAVLGLADPRRTPVPRGTIRPGWAADVVIFAPGSVIDRADYLDPHRPAEGMAGVWVDGHLSWREGAPVPGPGHGRVLRDRPPTSP